MCCKEKERVDIQGNNYKGTVPQRETESQFQAQELDFAKFVSFFSKKVTPPSIKCRFCLNWITKSQFKFHESICKQTVLHFLPFSASINDGDLEINEQPCSKGKKKCQFCGNIFSTDWLKMHETSCMKNEQLCRQIVPSMINNNPSKIITPKLLAPSNQKETYVSKEDNLFPKSKVQEHFIEQSQDPIESIISNVNQAQQKTTKLLMENKQIETCQFCRKCFPKSKLYMHQQTCNKQQSGKFERIVKCRFCSHLFFTIHPDKKEPTCFPCIQRTQQTGREMCKYCNQWFGKIGQVKHEQSCEKFIHMEENIKDKEKTALKRSLLSSNDQENDLVTIKMSRKGVAKFDGRGYNRSFKPCPRCNRWFSEEQLQNHWLANGDTCRQNNDNSVITISPQLGKCTHCSYFLEESSLKSNETHCRDGKRCRVIKYQQCQNCNGWFEGAHICKENLMFYKQHSPIPFAHPYANNLLPPEISEDVPSLFQSDVKMHGSSVVPQTESGTLSEGQIKTELYVPDAGLTDAIDLKTENKTEVPWYIAEIKKELQDEIKSENEVTDWETPGIKRSDFP